MILAIALAGLAVLVFELVTWRLFRRKIDGLTFPPATDGSDLPFFTLQRLRMIAALHALWLFGGCTALFWILW